MFFFFPEESPSNADHTYQSPFESIKQIDDDGTE